MIIAVVNNTILRLTINTNEKNSMKKIRFSLKGKNSAYMLISI